MRCFEAVRHSNPAPAFRRLVSRCRYRRGVALVWSALVLGAMVLIMGLSVDWGKAAYNIHELQNAADSAALAAAQWVKVDQVVTRDRGQQFGLFNDTERTPVQIARNDENIATGELVIGRFYKHTRTFVATLENPNAVKVVAHRTQAAHGPIATIFGHMAGVDTLDITCEAIARSTGATGAGLICLDHHAAPGLEIGGDVVLDVQGGDIVVNSDAVAPNFDSVVIDGGAGFVDCDTLKTMGEITLNGPYEPEDLPMFLDTELEEPVPDPLGELEEPVYSGWTPVEENLVSVTTGDVVTLSPGLYAGGFAMNGGDWSSDVCS
ncbi:MAG: hypothetical protein JSW27_11000, partial [Phycisphaerales bacterium]